VDIQNERAAEAPRPSDCTGLGHIKGKSPWLDQEGGDAKLDGVEYSDHDAMAGAE
jgi:hypothetical protein